MGRFYLEWADFLKIYVFYRETELGSCVGVGRLIHSPTNGGFRFVCSKNKVCIVVLAEVFLHMGVSLPR